MPQITNRIASRLLRLAVPALLARPASSQKNISKCSRLHLHPFLKTERGIVLRRKMTYNRRNKRLIEWKALFWIKMHKQLRCRTGRTWIVEKVIMERVLILKTLSYLAQVTKTSTAISTQIRIQCRKKELRIRSISQIRWKFTPCMACHKMSLLHQCPVITKVLMMLLKIVKKRQN